VVVIKTAGVNIFVVTYGNLALPVLILHSAPQRDIIFESLTLSGFEKAEKIFRRRWRFDAQRCFAQSSAGQWREGCSRATRCCVAEQSHWHLLHPLSHHPPVKHATWVSRFFGRCMEITFLNTSSASACTDPCLHPSTHRYALLLWKWSCIFNFTSACSVANL